MEINGTGKAVLFLPLVRPILVYLCEYYVMETYITTMETQKNYCIRKGKEILYALSAEQLDDIYRSIGFFLREDNELVPVLENEVSDMEMVIQKEIELSIQSNVCKVFYNIYTPEGEITYLSYEQVRQLSVLLQTFLAKYGDSEIAHGDSVQQQIEDVPAEGLLVEEDSQLSERPFVFEAEVSVGKYIRCSAQNASPQVDYYVYSNERSLNDLQPWQLYTLYRKLDDFLMKRV